MCCFSMARPTTLLGRLFPPKVHVSQTNIFARLVEPGVQALAYGMDLQTRHEVAMVLPLPVARGAGEDAVRFVDLSATPRMFAELGALFAEPPSRKGGVSRRLAPAEQLVVHEVGAFVASYVPGRADFARLDPRFRLPEVLFDEVPHYKDYGFAVFQLKPGNVTVHPMGLVFPTRERTKVFFPTVHVHDGQWRSRAKFDHSLYYQDPRRCDPGGELDGDPVSHTRPSKTYGGLVEPAWPVVRRTLRATLPNRDTWIDA